jgi:quercetin dioxygenase-like cupin family protein
MTSVVGAKDLSSVDPHPLHAELEGYAWLPRMLDKARATLAGTNGDYMFGCPVDHTCMARLGITPELVLELAGRHGEDREVLAELRRHGIPSAEEAWFDAPAVEDELQELDLYLRVRRQEQLPSVAGAAVFAGADHGAGVTVCLLELQPGGEQPAHAHPAEEVIVVTAGEATVYLGRHQARIIRRGEFARVPAGCPHRIEATGAQRFQCVLASAGANVELAPTSAVEAPPTA